MQKKWVFQKFEILIFFLIVTFLKNMCPEAAKLILSIKLFIIKLILGGIRLILILVKMALMKPIDLKEKNIRCSPYLQYSSLILRAKDF